jgi:hypothetical protein
MYEVLAFYCTVLGELDFDYNTVTYTKVLAYKTSYLKNKSNQKKVTEKK